MIDDLDRTLRELLRNELRSSPFPQASITFSAPDKEFPPSAVNLFLYDVRENRELRNAEWITEHQNGGATRHRPVARVDCSYLVTAWPSENAETAPFEEHRLLSDVLVAFLRHPVIPDAVLQGQLRGQQPPLRAGTVRSGRDENPAELWRGLGGKPRAALSYTVTISMPLDVPVETEKLVREKELQFRPSVEREEQLK